ncbi:MAG TPA: hypothetical protein VKG92_01925, partial [Flavobacteriales bacterium]|nr:hypothetical protein [Flavobacteriales bacterium]
PDPCLYSPTPRIDLNSWPGGLHPDSTWIVSYDDILLSIHLVADGSSDPAEDVKLTSLNIAILATGTDSTMFATSQNPNSFSATINTTATIDTLTTNVPAQLRISTGNSCSGGNSMVRKLLITP